MGNKVLVFTAPWCAPCKVLKDQLQSVDDFEYRLVDVSENEELSNGYDIISVPTVIFLDEESKPYNRLIGGINSTLSNIRGIINGG